MAFFEAVDCHLVQITMKLLKIIKMFFSEKKSISQTTWQLELNTNVLK